MIAQITITVKVTLDYLLNSGQNRSVVDPFEISS